MSKSWVGERTCYEVDHRRSLLGHCLHFVRDELRVLIVVIDTDADGGQSNAGQEGEENLFGSDSDEEPPQQHKSERVRGGRGQGLRTDRRHVCRYACWVFSCAHMCMLAQHVILSRAAMYS